MLLAKREILILEPVQMQGYSSSDEHNARFEKVLRFIAANPKTRESVDRSIIA